MIQFFMKFFLFNKNTGVEYRKNWGKVGILILFIYILLLFVITKEIKNLIMYSIFILFVFSVIGFLLAVIIDTVIVYILDMIFYAGNRQPIKKVFSDYLPYYVVRSFYLMVITLVFNFMGVHNRVISRGIELLLFVYTYILFCKNRQIR